MHTLDSLAFSWMGPIFFVILGTKLVIEPAVLLEVLGTIFTLYATMCVLQFFSAACAARYVPGGYNFVESVMIGFGMLGRAELAFVVLDIGYNQNDIFDKKAFYTLMITCFLLNVTAPLVIQWWKPYYTGLKKLPVKWLMPDYQRGGMEHEGSQHGSAHVRDSESTIIAQLYEHPAAPGGGPAHGKDLGPGAVLELASSPVLQVARA